jgi:hypothetical protein
MKRIYVSLLTSILMATAANAQFKLPKALIAFHGMYAQPMENAIKKDFNFGLGGEFEFGAGIGKTMITASAGYMNYTADKSTNNSLSFIPVRVGLRRYFTLGFFANASAGVAFQSLDSAKFVSSDPSLNNALKKSTNFVYEAGLGFKFIGIEAVANYTAWKNNDAKDWNSGLVFKLGYAIKL